MLNIPQTIVVSFGLVEGVSQVGRGKYLIHSLPNVCWAEGWWSLLKVHGSWSAVDRPQLWLDVSRCYKTETRSLVRLNPVSAFFPHKTKPVFRDTKRLQFHLIFPQDVTESAAELELLEGKIAPDVQVGKCTSWWQKSCVIKQSGVWSLISNLTLCILVHRSYCISIGI